MSTSKPDGPEPEVVVEFDGADYWRRWARRDEGREEIPDSFVSLLDALADAWESDSWETFEGQLRSMDREGLEHALGRFVRMYWDFEKLDVVPDQLLGGIDGLVKQVDRRLTELKH